MRRLAVITTHPIQYYAPWFRHLARCSGLDLRVFYLWDFGVAERTDPGFAQVVKWDVPLLDGYEWEMVPNRSRHPGTHHFRGIDNPDLEGRLRAWRPHASLCMGYNFKTFCRLLLTSSDRRGVLLLRGDSHRLKPRMGPAAWLKRRVITWLFRRFSGFLYVGSANREYFRLHGAKEDRLFFSPHAVDNERFTSAKPVAAVDAAAWKRALGIAQDRLVVLFVGKLEETKRPQDLLAAFVAAKLPNAVLLFVGAGPLEQSLRQSALAYSNVFFAGFQNQTLMPRTYAAGNLLVLPSAGETWGLCVNEAMCLGLPTIVSSHVGCGPDLVLPGKTGWIFEAGRVDALSALLRKIFAAPLVMEEAGRAASAHIQSYSFEQASAGVEAAMNSLCPLVA
jgi:glycosyltransferase involved in cell wall biosynthesis